MKEEGVVTLHLLNGHLKISPGAGVLQLHYSHVKFKPNVLIASLIT